MYIKGLEALAKHSRHKTMQIMRLLGYSEEYIKEYLLNN